jgi:dihydrofolate reductase
MPQVRIHNFSISVDGFGTGELLSAEAPFGHAGRRLHEWMFATQFGHQLFGREGGSLDVDNSFAVATNDGIGVEIMGAGKFGPPGWQDDPTWQGWWGPNPPFHTPVVVYTQHEAEPIVMEGGTTFHFVQGSPTDVLARATELAGGLDIRLGGGVTTVRTFLAADLVDYAHIVQVPIWLGRGESLWQGLEGLEDRYVVTSTPSPSGVTHLTLERRS